MLPAVTEPSNYGCTKALITRKGKIQNNPSQEASTPSCLDHNRDPSLFGLKKKPHLDETSKLGFLKVEVIRNPFSSGSVHTANLHLFEV